MATATCVCVNCGAPATSRCSSCTEGLDVDSQPVPPTSYCGRACQKAYHKSKHADECRASNARKQLYRAGAFVQELFYRSRLRCWSKTIEKVNVGDDGKIESHYAEPTDDTVFTRFPTEMFANEADMHAVLADQAGIFALRDMDPILQLSRTSPLPLPPPLPGNVSSAVGTPTIGALIVSTASTSTGTPQLLSTATNGAGSYTWRTINGTATSRTSARSCIAWATSPGSSSSPFAA